MLKVLNDVVWGAPALLAILCVGLYFTFRSNFLQITMFKKAAVNFVTQFKVRRKGKTNSSYRSLCTALAATVGTGNIVGVSGAIIIGGPGSIFWMWICGLLGMIIKFAEATLAIHYREKNQEGEFCGGPMYMIKNGLGKRWLWLAYCYCIFGVIASFGVGNAAQVNAIVESIGSVVGEGATKIVDIRYLIGVSLGVIVAAVLLGGAKRIGQLAEGIIPISAVIYITLCICVLADHVDRVPFAFSAIVHGAISPKAVTGGVLGSAFKALMVGASRGTFTNEAGMGTASIAHAGANVGHPVEQGLMGLWEVFIDTIVICTMTALVILCSGICVPYGEVSDATLTIRAFEFTIGVWIEIPLVVIVCSFAVATIFGWSLYGIRCMQFLLGERSWRLYVVLQVLVVGVSSLIKTETVWSFSEIMNGLMLIPNIFALLCLSPNLMRLIADYKQNDKNLTVNLTNMDKKW